jgi:hypothetical protein
MKEEKKPRRMKDKDDVLKGIFDNDPFGLLNVESRKSAVRTSDERLASSFDEINDFIEKNQREPKPDSSNISEYKLYSTLRGLRENEQKMMALEPQDKYGLLKDEKKEITSIDDMLEDDSLGLLGDDSEGLFTFKHTPKDFERARADFIGKRFKCKDFDRYEPLFQEVQNDLALGKRKLVDFNYENLRKGDFYVNNGILLFLKDVDFSKQVQTFKTGVHNRPDGRTVTIFENGTESNMMFQSLYKTLHFNGKMVTQNSDRISDDLITSFSDITEKDEEAGYIYVLKSESLNEEISSTENLHKIGFTSSTVQDRIKNAENEPTYLMAPVRIESSWMCYNMNARKFEQLIHKFFGHSCLEVDVFDGNGIRHTPREWFIVPMQAIEQAIALIMSGDIVDYRYDKINQVIIEK